VSPADSAMTTEKPTPDTVTIDRAVLEQVKAAIPMVVENEATKDPWWAIVTNSPRGEVVHAGPYFSREQAREFLENHRHRFSKSAFVFCFSGFQSPEYKSLRAALTALDSALSSPAEPTRGDLPGVTDAEREAVEWFETWEKVQEPSGPHPHETMGLRLAACVRRLSGVSGDGEGA
jgi:hypothetical protein